MLQNPLFGKVPQFLFGTTGKKFFWGFIQKVQIHTATLYATIFFVNRVFGCFSPSVGLIIKGIRESGGSNPPRTGFIS